MIGESVRFEKNADTLFNMLIDNNRTETSVKDIMKVTDKYDGLKQEMDKAEEDNKRLQDRVKILTEEKERQGKIIKRAEEEAARSRESETRAREDAIRLQAEADNERRNGDLDRARRLHLEGEKAQQDNVKYREQRERSEKEGADAKWKYTVAAAILAALAFGGLTGVAGLTCAGLSLTIVGTLNAFLAEKKQD